MSSIEYAGVLAIVATVFIAMVALDLDSKVGTTVRTALCQIFGGECGGDDQQAAAPERCETGSETTKSNANVLIAVVQIDKDSTLIRQEYSDGAVKFTILDNTEAAGELFAGVKGKIAKYGVDYSLSADAGIGLEGAQEFFFTDPDDADAFQETVQAAGGFDGILRSITHADDEIPLIGVKNPLGGVNDWALDRLGIDDDEDLPTPSAEYTTGKLFVDGNAGAGVGFGALDADLKAMLRGAGGVKYVTAGKDKGDVEFSFEVKGEGNASLGADIFGAGAGASGDANFTATLKLDAQNDYKPDQLVVKGAAGYTGNFDIHANLEADDIGDVKSSLEKLSFSDTAGEGHGIEFKGTLDLKDPENLSATLALLSGAGNPGGSGPAAAQLVRRFDEDGKLELDTFDTSKSETSGEVKVGVGVGGGAGGSSETEGQSGREGEVRLPGGTFQPRVCLGPS